MRRLTAGLTAFALLAAGAVGGFAAGRLTADGDDEDQAGQVSDDDYDRLVDACQSATGEGNTCLGFVEWIVDVVESEGCGYPEAVELLDRDIRSPDANGATWEQRIEDVTDNCDGQ